MTLDSRGSNYTTWRFTIPDNLPNEDYKIDIEAIDCVGNANVIPEAWTGEIISDSDSDGVTDVAVDLNQIGNFNDDDTDRDGTPNYLDPDDYGDGLNKQGWGLLCLKHWTGRRT